MSRENAEFAALSAVGKYIEYSPNVLLYKSLYDDTPKDKGELRVFLYEERVSNLFGVIPIIVKWSKNANTTPYRLDRRYLNSLKEDKGGVFFLVQRSTRRHERVLTGNVCPCLEAVGRKGGHSV